VTTRSKHALFVPTCARTQGGQGEDRAFDLLLVELLFCLTRALLHLFPMDVMIPTPHNVRRMFHIKCLNCAFLLGHTSK
jgi:hypothetical protein